MKRLLMVLVLGLASVACSNDCDEAVDKLEECGASDVTGADADECDGASECVAGCINDASCDEIKNGSDKFSACVLGC
jgi:hypothetical protein